MPEHIRELNLVRTQLNGFLEQMTEEAGGAPADDGVCRPMFPDGSTSITEASKRLLDGISAADFQQFETTLQSRLRHECRGLVGVCTRPKEFASGFVKLLLDQTAKFLGIRMEQMAQANATTVLPADPAECRKRLEKLSDDAQPLDLGQGRPAVTLVAFPESAGPVAQTIREITGEGDLRTVFTNEDLIIWRECRDLSVSDFRSLMSIPPIDPDGHPLRSCHTRIDVSWIPVEVE